MANNSSESNKDFVLLSTNLNAYKSADDNRTLSNNNDRNFLFTKVDNSNSGFDLISSSSHQHHHGNINSNSFKSPNDSVQFDFQACRQQSISADNFRPVTSSYHQAASEQIIHDETNKLHSHNNYASNINNRTSYDWTQNQQQLNYTQYPAILSTQPVNSYQGYSNQSKYLNNNNYFFSTGQPYQTSVYENASAPRLSNANLPHSYNNYNTNCFGYSNSDCSSTKPDGLANCQTSLSTSQHNGFPLKTSPITVAASGSQYSAPNSFDCHFNINQASSSQFSDLSSQMLYAHPKVGNTSIPGSSFHNANNIAELSQIAANTNYQALDQCRTLSFSNVSSKININNSKSTMPNDSLQSPSTSSSSSGSYSSNGIENHPESLSSDIDEDDDDDDEDEEDSEEDNQNEKTNKNKQTHVNAPWAQPG